VRRWFRRRPSDDEMREELEAHVAMRAAHDGVTEAAARRRLGNALRTREAMRRVWIAEWWDALRQDARFTFRSWRRQPGFALASILVLALGLGASTALFAALDRVLFRPLPYADPDRLVSVGLRSLHQGGAVLNQGDPLLDTGYVQVWQATPEPFESVTAMDTATCDIAEEPAERVRCGSVDANFLRVLGVRVALGRDFATEEDVRGAPPVALISHDLWLRRYGADPHVVGRALTLDRPTARALQRVPIVGVLPAGFEMPVEEADILLPFQLRPLDPQQPFATFISVFARLKPGMTRERAALMLAPQLNAMAESLPPGNRPAVWSVRSVRDRRVGDAARVGWLLLAAVAVVLLIACVNVTNLMLARVADRQREFAVRAAVGAGTRRLACLAAAESVLLALTAGGVGLLVAVGLLRTFVALAPASIPNLGEASVDSRVFAVALVLVAVAAVAIGLGPAIAVSRLDGLRGLRSATSSPAATPHVRFVLVTTQIGLTLALLAGSALLQRSLWNVVSVPLGFDADRVITLTAALSTSRYPTPERTAAFFEELLARARATPGAVSAVLSNAPVPRGASRVSSNVAVDGRTADPDARQQLRIRDVTPQYFEMLRIPLVTGRTFEQADRDGEPVAVVSATAARMLFPGGRGLDQRIRPHPDEPWYRVVGVSADIRNGLRVTDAPEPEIYVLVRRGTWRNRIGRLALQTSASPADAEAMLRRIVADLDPQLPVTIETVEHQVAALTARPRFMTSLLTTFAAFALLLAAAGLYSVAAYLVTQRRRDTAVRVALGAAPRDVAGLVVGEAGRWIVGGALLGCALGWAGTRALQSELHDVQPLDPWSWAAALLALGLALLVAVFRPAYRAAHVDPIAALRAE
jgi:putative ABC transport system permease protein